MMPLRWNVRSFLRQLAGTWRGCRAAASLELRSASRRKRTYLIRMGYVALLCLYVTLVWGAVVSWADGGGFTRSRMAFAGIEIGVGLMWFLLLAGPAAAVLIAADCFHEEIHEGGLTLMLSAPLDYASIAAGKFLARLWQPLILLAAAVPVLALVRVFGGVPIVLVAASLTLGMGGTMLAAAVTAYYSAIHDGPYRIILRSACVVLLLNVPIWIGAAMLSAAVHGGYSTSRMWFWVILAGCQFWLTLRFLAGCAGRLAVRAQVVLGNVSKPGLTPPNFAGPAGRPEVAEKALAFLADLRDRQRGRPGAAPAAPPARSSRACSAAVEDSAERGERIIPWPLSITGSPIVWREMKRSYLTDPKTRRIVLGLMIAPLPVLGWFLAFGHGFHLLVLCGSLGAYAGMLAVSSASLITSERQRGCLHLLLTTPLSDGQILRAKIRAALWKASPAMQFAGVHVAMFALTCMLPWTVVIAWASSVVQVTAVVLGLGLLCSCTFRRSNTAMAVCFGLLTLGWLLGPALVDLIGRACGGPGEGLFSAEALVRLANPFWVIWACLEDATAPGQYRGYGHNARFVAGTGIRQLAGLYPFVWLASVAAGGCMIRLARRRLRRL